MTHWVKRVYFCVAGEMCDGRYTAGLLIYHYSYAVMHHHLHAFNMSLIIHTEKHHWKWLRWLVTDLSLQRPRFDPIPVHMGFVLDKIVL
jgi:hypothetical protein